MLFFFTVAIRVLCIPWLVRTFSYYCNEYHLALVSRVMEESLISSRHERLSARELNFVESLSSIQCSRLYILIQYSTRRFTYPNAHYGHEQPMEGV